MTVEIIQEMINNSTWTNTKNSNVYKFLNHSDLVVNDQKSLKYSLNTSENKVVIQLENSNAYFVEYVNDFMLNFYNSDEKFRIVVA